LSYIGSKPANKPVVASDLDPAVITGQTELAVAPADTDEFLISDGGVLKRLDASLVGSPGITNSQQWRISADQTGMNNGDVISNNWEVSDTTGYGGIGSAMSQSSGIFTFPSTGIWLIKFTYVGFGGDQTQDYIGATTESTTDNSTYAVANEGYNNADNNQYVVVNLNLIFDVTNTTTHKVKFSVTAQNNGIKAMGNTAKNLTNAVFTRLGDT
jgi:hypothetical protein